MTTAMFSVLLPQKHIPPHRGPWKGVLRYHLALRTPADETAARIRVGSRVEHWRDGRSLVFDDTFEHEAWNDSDEIRVVLFVDFIRKLPWYLAAPNRACIGAIRRSPFIQRAAANNEAWQETLGATDQPTPRCTRLRDAAPRAKRAWSSRMGEHSGRRATVAAALTPSL